MTRPGIEPRSPRPLANTLTAGPSQCGGCSTKYDTPSLKSSGLRAIPRLTLHGGFETRRRRQNPAYRLARSRSLRHRKEGKKARNPRPRPILALGFVLSYRFFYFCLLTGRLLGPFGRYFLLLLFYVSSSPIAYGQWPLCAGMSSFKLGWLHGSNLDNAPEVFAYVSLGGWAMLFDGGCIDDLILLSMVCSTGVLSPWYPPALV